MPGALEDLRVIDFTHALNGPFARCCLGIWEPKSLRSSRQAATSFADMDAARRKKRWLRISVD